MVSQSEDKPEINSDDAFEQRSRELFNDQVASLDARTHSRLNQARQAALDVARGKTRSAYRGWLIPAGSAAALALAVVLVQSLRPASEPTGSALASSVADVEILTDDTELEMLQNMDFYAWVAEQPEDSGALSGSEAG